MSATDLKRRFLEVASEVAVGVEGERPLASAFSDVSLEDVAEARGLKRASMYRHWPTRQEFGVHLAHYAMDRVGAPPIAKLLDFTPTRGETLAAVRRVAAQALEAAERDLSVVMRATVLGYPDASDAIRALVPRQRRELQRTAANVRDFLTLHGRVCSGTLNELDLATVLWCLVDGFASIARGVPATADRVLDLGDGEGPCKPVSVAVHGLLDGATISSSETRSDISEPADGCAAADGERDSLPTVAAWTRTQLADLEAGYELLLERIATGTFRDRVGPLRHVTLERVARRAGVSRQALYHYWNGQEDLIDDLREYAWDREREVYWHDFDAHAAQALARPQDFALTMCEGVNAWRYQPPRPRLVVPRLAFAANIMHTGNPLLATSLDRQAGVVQFALGSFGVELRDGIDVYDVALIAGAIANGSENMHRSEPAAIRQGLDYRGGRWTSLAIAFQMIVDFCVPDLAARYSGG